MYTQEQLTALQAALARGEKRVTFGDKTVEYRSVEEIERAISTISRALAQQSGVAPVRQVRVATCKGF
ncbi:MAG: phage head-tail joining protein [Thiomonas sp.]|jgi:hypothetical protein